MIHQRFLIRTYHGLRQEWLHIGTKLFVVRIVDVSLQVTLLLVSFNDSKFCWIFHIYTERFNAFVHSSFCLPWLTNQSIVPLSFAYTRLASINFAFTLSTCSSFADRCTRIVKTIVVRSGKQLECFVTHFLFSYHVSLHRYFCDRKNERKNNQHRSHLGEGDVDQ